MSWHGTGIIYLISRINVTRKKYRNVRWRYVKRVGKVFASMSKMRQTLNKQVLKFTHGIKYAPA